jgi:hypothetical protein
MAGRRVMSEDLKNVEFETSEDVDVTPTFDNKIRTKGSNSSKIDPIYM